MYVFFVYGNQSNILLTWWFCSSLERSWPVCILSKHKTLSPHSRTHHGNLMGNVENFLTVYSQPCMLVTEPLRWAIWDCNLIPGPSLYGHSSTFLWCLQYNGPPTVQPMHYNGSVIDKHTRKLKQPTYSLFLLGNNRTILRALSTVITALYTPDRLHMFTITHICT